MTQANNNLNKNLLPLQPQKAKRDQKRHFLQTKSDFQNLFITNMQSHSANQKQNENDGIDPQDSSSLQQRSAQLPKQKDHPSNQIRRPYQSTSSRISNQVTASTGTSGGNKTIKNNPAIRR